MREGGSALLAAYAYDDLGRRKTLSRGNGVTTTYGYDAGSRLTGLSHDLAGTGQDLSVTFGYNGAGQITSRTSSNELYAWTGAVAVNRGYATNPLNQYTSAGGTSFGYDARGNLTSSGSTTYQYNTRNQLFMSGGQLIYRNPAGELGQVLLLKPVFGYPITARSSLVFRRPQPESLQHDYRASWKVRMPHWRRLSLAHGHDTTLEGSRFKGGAPCPMVR